MQVLLLPAWLAFRPVVWLRNTGYDLGLLRARRLPVPVISVGNIAVGGTGKTPVVAAVVAELERLGRRPAVLARGYKALPNEDGA